MFGFGGPGPGGFGGPGPGGHGGFGGPGGPMGPHPGGFFGRGPGGFGRGPFGFGRGPMGFGFGFGFGFSHRGMTRSHFGTSDPDESAYKAYDPDALPPPPKGLFGKIADFFYTMPGHPVRKKKK